MLRTLPNVVLTPHIADATPGAEAALIAHCASQIANYKVPKHVLAIAEFPFTPSANGNKIQKAKLRDMATVQLQGKLV